MYTKLICLLKILCVCVGVFGDQKSREVRGEEAVGLEEPALNQDMSFIL